MGRGSFFFATILAVFASALAYPAHAETAIIRPGPCAAQSTYLLAANSGALIRVERAGAGDRSDQIIVFRHNPIRGWASQRLLRRFDLKLDDNGGRIFNSGAFCTER